ncbi:MAG: hypothetical protein WC681_19590, partial [Sterolibacterium sp.]
MTSAIEYALMAGAAYYDNRADVNRISVPSGWNMVSRFPVAMSNGTGFEASAFGNGTSLTNSTDIVISFAGTELLQIGDWTSGPSDCPLQAESHCPKIWMSIREERSMAWAAGLKMPG